MSRRATAAIVIHFVVATLYTLLIALVLVFAAYWQREPHETVTARLIAIAIVVAGLFASEIAVGVAALRRHEWARWSLVIGHGVIASMIVLVALTSGDGAAAGVLGAGSAAVAILLSH